jgi:hypothetical protein
MPVTDVSKHSLRVDSDLLHVLYGGYGFLVAEKAEKTTVALPAEVFGSAWTTTVVVVLIADELFEIASADGTAVLLFDVSLLIVFLQCRFINCAKPVVLRLLALG